MAVDGARQGGLRVEEASDVARRRVEREARRPAVQQLALGEGRLHRRAEIVGRPGKRGEGLRAA